MQIDPRRPCAGRLSPSGKPLLLCMPCERRNGGADTALRPIAPQARPDGAAWACRVRVVAAK